VYFGDFLKSDTMPRRGKRARRSRRNGGSGNMASRNSVGGQTVRVPFRTLLDLASVAGVFTLGSLNLNPGNMTGSRLLTILATFKYFRFTDLRITVKHSVRGVSLIDPTPHVTSGGFRSYICFATDAVGDMVAPGSGSDMAQLESFAHSGAGDGMFLKLGRMQLLKRPNKWWRTNGVGSPSVDEVVQGSFFFATDQDASWSGVQYFLEILLDGVCEFTGMTENAIGLVDKPVSHIDLATGKFLSGPFHFEEKKESLPARFSPTGGAEVFNVFGLGPEHSAPSAIVSSERSDEIVVDLDSIELPSVQF